MSSSTTQQRSSDFGRFSRFVAGLGLAVVLIGPAIGGAAQEASPGADVPAASECTVDPADITTLLGAAGGADPNSPLFTTQPVEEATLPDGPAVTDEELNAITDTVHQLVACANAFDPLRILALISDQYIGQLANAALAAQEQPELAEQLLVRFPVPLGAVAGGEPVAMVPVRDARLLPDGRIGAILESTIATASGADVTALFYVAFIEGEDRWLVDEVLPVAGEAFGTPASTPVASR